MFREMRRKDKAMTLEAAKAVLEKADYGILSINADNGYPYAVALNYAYDGEHIYFHSAASGAKTELLAADERVCFNVVSDYKILSSQFDTDYHNVVVFGRVTCLEGEEKLNALRLLIQKYSGEHYEAGMTYIQKGSGATKAYRLTVDHMTGKFQGE